MAGNNSEQAGGDPASAHSHGIPIRHLGRGPSIHRDAQRYSPIHHPDQDADCGLSVTHSLALTHPDERGLPLVRLRPTQRWTRASWRQMTGINGSEIRPGNSAAGAAENATYP